MSFPRTRESPRTGTEWLHGNNSKQQDPVKNQLYWIDIMMFVDIDISL
jgi:hypothetical protein